MNDPLVSGAPKSLKRFMKEAVRMEQMKQTNIAYYCRLHALKEGMNLNPRPTEWINSAFGKLEQTKPSDLPAAEQAHLEEIEVLAMKMFDHADDIDRAGNADKRTALTFSTASILLTVLQSNQGDAFAPDLDEKRKYALWKTTDILKAIRAGVKPTPGPPGGTSEEEVMPSPTQPSEPSPVISEPAAPAAPIMTGTFTPLDLKPVPAAPAAQPSVPSFSSSAAPAPMRGANFEDKVQACARAESIMKHAFSAMRFNDVNTAISKLEEAIAIMTPHRDS